MRYFNNKKETKWMIKNKTQLFVMTGKGKRVKERNKTHQKN